MAEIAARLARWPFALAASLLLAAAILLPGLGASGLWEPQERSLADRIAPPLGSPAAEAAVKPASRPPPAARAGAGAGDCERAAPADPAARSLASRATRWGRDTVGDSDAGRRLPFALLGMLTVLATAGIAIRLAGARAGVLAAIMLLAMPLMTLQSRTLTSEIGTTAGVALIVYALVALGQLGGARRFVVQALDAVVAIAALAGGAALGFYGGGALIGLVVPIGAVALAGAFGVPIVRAVRRGEPIAPPLVALIAGLAALAVLGVLADQLYDLETPYPGMTPPPLRELFGKAIVPTGCYSPLLGGVWRPEDDLRMIFDSTFEQIGHGTLPWGLLAPIAMAALLGSGARLGALTLAWAGVAWVVAEVFQRKVGFTLYTGFPALAIASAAWLDGVLAGRARGDDTAMPAGAKLIALFMVLGVITLGKDLHSFAVRLTSLLVGGEGVPYPARSTLLFLPTKTWVLIVSAAAMICFAIALTTWRTGSEPSDRRIQRRAGLAAGAAILATVVLAAFWSAIWQPRLASHLSSKAILETYRALAAPGEELIVMGDLGQAPLAYTGAAQPVAIDRTAVVTALGKPSRVFAIAPQSELCTLHRELSGKPYFVVDDRNERNLLLSNRVDGTTDKNPLRTAIAHEQPTAIRTRPKGRVVWDNRIELLGWDMPRAAGRGVPFEIIVYYKILQPVGGAWKTLMHFDGRAGRAGNGDHEPINGRCPTSTWSTGDYIIDRFTVRVGGGALPAANYDVWLGFFTGSAPSFRNMPVSEAPGDMRDNADRVKITTIALE